MRSPRVLTSTSTPAHAQTLSPGSDYDVLSKSFRELITVICTSHEESKQLFNSMREEFSAVISLVSTTVETPTESLTGPNAKLRKKPRARCGLDPDQ